MQTQKQFCWGKVSMYYVFQNIVSAPKRAWGGAEALRDGLSRQEGCQHLPAGRGRGREPKLYKVIPHSEAPIVV